MQNALLDHLGEMMPATTTADEDELLDELPPPLRVLWLLDWLDFEVAQGGLLTYLTNAHGRHAPLAAAALRDIGATTMAAVLETATVCAPPSHPTSPAVPPNLDVPHAVALIELTDRYEQAAETDDWGQKLDAFLKRAISAEAEAAVRPARD